MEEQIYHLRIFCTKGPGVFVQLMQSLEALGLEIRNANLTSFQENLLNTFIAEVSKRSFNAINILFLYFVVS